MSRPQGALIRLKRRLRQLVVLVVAVWLVTAPLAGVAAGATSDAGTEQGGATPPAAQSGDGAGAANASHDGRAGASGATSQNIKQMQLGETINSDGQAISARTFTASKGTTIRASIETSAPTKVIGIFDCKIKLFESGCVSGGPLTEIAISSNDDVDRDTSATVVRKSPSDPTTIERYELPSDGTYTVLAVAGTTESGSERLTKSPERFRYTVERIKSQAPQKQKDLRSISYGETKRGYVDGNDSRKPNYLGGFDYEPVTFSGSAGDVVEVDMDPTGSGQVPSARVRGPSGYLDLTADGTYVLPADGQYTIEAGFVGTNPGGYQLSLSTENGGPPTVSIDAPENVTAGEQVTLSARVGGKAGVDAYEWTIADGEAATGQEVTYTFSEPGKHPVTVTVKAGGQTVSTSTTVSVTSTVGSKYDADGDGLETRELERALNDLEGAPPDTDAVENGSEAESGGANLSVDEARQAIEEKISEETQPPTTEVSHAEDHTDANETDTDGDGLSDAVERAGVPVLKSQVGEQSKLAEAKDGDDDIVARLNTSVTAADTDGDSLSDLEELGGEGPLADDIGQTYYVLNSDPTVASSADSDGDGLPDELEETGVPVLRSKLSPDADTVPALSSDPQALARLNTSSATTDTDGDGLSDREELGAEKTFQTPTGAWTYYVLDSDPTVAASADSDGDGLPDKLEQRGIPILKPTDAYRLGKVGEDANVTTLEDDPAAILRLDTDPSASDTDGDGLSDGEELRTHYTFEDLASEEAPDGLAAQVITQYGAAVTASPDQRFYVLESDPTDPNTDDTGYPDATETNKIGSNPKQPEYLSVDVVFPVTGKQNCDPVTEKNLVRDCARDFNDEAGDELLNVDESPVHILRPTATSSGGAGWLSGIDTSSGKEYFLVKVTVEVSYENLPQNARPHYIKFTRATGTHGSIVGVGTSKSNISPGYAPRLPTDGDGGTVGVYLVIAAGQSFGNKDIGQIVAKVDTESGSIASRPSDSGDAVMSTTTPMYIQNNVAYTSGDAARQMVKEATKKWAQSTITAAVPTGGGLAKASFGGSLGTAAKVYIDGTAALTSSSGQDELFAKAVVSEGAVPGYLKPRNDPPIANQVMTLYREN